MPTSNSVTTQTVTSVSKDQLRDLLPKSLKNSVSDEAIDHINLALTNHAYAEQLRDNILGYVHVMKDGKFKVTDYISAVMYVSYKLMGDSNINAYSKVFPNKISEWNARGIAPKDIASMVASYNKNKLVNLIYEQTVVPVWVLNQDNYQKAINVQVDLMLNAQSEKVRSDAANSLLTHLKKPETTKVEIDVSVDHGGSVLNELYQATQALVDQQKAALLAGSMTAQGIAHSRIIQGEVVDVTQ